MSTQMTINSSVSGIQLLTEWANGQENWIRQLVKYVIASKSTLNNEHIDKLCEIFLLENKLQSGEFPETKPLSVSDKSISSADEIRIDALEHMGNVNALAPKQLIEFSPQFTVCYGENASGKSSYVRILKRVAGVRTSEPILPNIYDETQQGAPKARFKVSVGGQEQLISWDGEQALDILKNVRIFDSSAAVVHLRSELDYAYTPEDLALFPLVMDGIDRVKSALEDFLKQRPKLENLFPDRFSDSPDILAALQTLDELTDLKELQQLANLSVDDEANFSEIEERVKRLAADSVAGQIAFAGREKAIMDEVANVARSITEFDVGGYNESVSKLRTAHASHEQASRTAFSGENILGVLSTSWQGFIEASEDYIKETGLDPYPDSDAPCIYCRQPLGEAAVELIQKYRAYTNALLRQELEQAQEQVRLNGLNVTELKFDETENGLSDLVHAQEATISGQSSVIAAMKVIEQARKLQHRIVAELDCPALNLEFNVAAKSVRSAINLVDEGLSDLRKRGNEREQAFSKASQRLNDITARLELRRSMPEIREYIQLAKWNRQFNRCLQSFPDVKRRLTITAKQASEEVMNGRFEQLFTEECHQLHAPSVKLNFPGREGNVRRRKSLSNEYDLHQILSEGEQKVIALADFLAETTLNPDCTPVVLDDPVTSLDHKRLRYVVERLVHLSEQRQVIVFTHDIWFVVELLQELSDVEFYDIGTDGDVTGIVSRGSHPRTDTFKDRNRRIANLTSEARRQTGGIQRSLVEKGYEELRGACEIVVEKDILKGVTQRFRPNVQMTVLSQIRADRLPKAVQQIDPIFDRCCRYIASHSQPLSTLGARPTLSDLEADWKALKDARKEYLKE